MNSIQDIVLRETRITELDAIHAMEERDARDFIIPYSLERHHEEFAKDSIRYLSIDVGGELSGFVILALDDDRQSVEFRRIVIAKPGQGIGSAALKLIDAYCMESLQRNRIWLDVFETNVRARHVYEKHGFTQFGQAIHDNRTLVLYQRPSDSSPTNPQTRACPRSAIHTDRSELKLLQELDSLLSRREVRDVIGVIVERVESRLTEQPQSRMAWEPIPLEIYGHPIAAEIRSSWVFILRAGTASGAERHPNSIQRVMSYRGKGDLQTTPQLDALWTSHFLQCDSRLPPQRRWLTVPANVWHQAVVAEDHWIVVSFHTAKPDELIEERPDDEHGAQRRHYITSGNMAEHRFSTKAKGQR